MSGEAVIGDPGAANCFKQLCFHNRIVNPAPWGISKVLKDPKSSDYLSEYQHAYKFWPFQPPRDPLKPKTAPHDTNATTDMLTMYKRDFVVHPMKGNRFSRPCAKKKKEDYLVPTHTGLVKTTYDHDFAEQRFNPSKSYRPKSAFSKPTVPFEGRSEYQAAFPAYGAEVVKGCRPPLVKTGDSIELTKTSIEKNASTNHNDFQTPVNGERPKPIVPKETQIKFEGSFDGTTMYSAAYKKPITQSPPGAKKSPVKTNNQLEKQRAPFIALTTNMVDYKHHKNATREASCRPPDANIKVSEVPFAKETTMSATYKSWPVTGKINPHWAKKADYKPPDDKILLQTTYMMDFKKPRSDNPVASPKVPQCAGENMLKMPLSVPKGDASTVYRGSYSAWENAKPSTPQKPERHYEPPKEKMLLQSTQRSHYRGEQTKRSEPCRHVSQHRRLNKETGMSFRTTYRDTYTSARPEVKRPKSSPPALRSAPASTTVLCRSDNKPDSNLNVSNDSGIDVGSP